MKSDTNKMGGIVIKPKIIVITKKNLMIYAALLLVLIAGLVLLFTLRSNEAGMAASGYTYLKYNDGTFVGTEKTELGAIKAEVTVKNQRIKSIKLLELPAAYMSENPKLKDEISDLIYSTIKNQEVAQVSTEGSSAYVINKVVKAVNHALNQSMLKE